MYDGIFLSQWNGLNDHKSTLFPPTNQISKPSMAIDTELSLMKVIYPNP